ncbi:hypothetical protein JXA40_08510 [bacterium]|nr:hypothetical protein [candidate division CSSED10-310 bacterium]
MAVDRSIRILLVFLSLFAVLPMFHDGYPWNDFHRDRLITCVIQTDTALDSGQFPVRWFPDVCRGLGSPYPLYESPLIFTVTWMLKWLWTGPVIRLKWLTLLLTAVGLSGMYRLGNTVGGPWAGFTASVLYLYAPFRIAQIQLLSDLTGYSAGAVFPWAVDAGIKYAACRRSILTAVVPAAALVWSDITGLGALILASILAPVISKAAGLAVRRHRIVVWVLVTLLASASFWIPTLFERSEIRQGHRDQLEGRPEDHLVYPHQYLAYRWGDGVSRPGPNDGIPFQIGMVHLFFAAALLAAPSRSAIRLKPAGFAVLILLVPVLFLTGTASVRLWETLRFLWMINHPWRLLWIVSALVSILAALWMASFRRTDSANRVAVLATGSALVILFLYGALFNHSGNPAAEPADRDSIRENGRDADWIQNHLPSGRAFPEQAVPFRFNVTAGDAVITRYFRDQPHRISFESRATMPSAAVAGIFPFPGWTVDIDGRRFPVETRTPEPVISFEIPPGNHRVTLAYKRTLVRQMADSISLAVILSLVAFQIIFRRSATAGLPPS